MNKRKKLVLSLLLAVLLLSSPIARAAASEGAPPGDESALSKQPDQTETRPTPPASESGESEAGTASDPTADAITEDPAASDEPEEINRNETGDQTETSDNRETDLPADTSEPIKSDRQPEENEQLPADEVVGEAASDTVSDSETTPEAAPGAVSDPEATPEAAPDAVSDSEATPETAPDAAGSDVTIPEVAPDNETSASTADSAQAEEADSEDQAAATNPENAANTLPPAASTVTETETGADESKPETVPDGPNDANAVTDELGNQSGAVPEATAPETTAPETGATGTTGEIAAEGVDTAEIAATEEISATETITAEEAAEIDAMVNEWLTVRANAAETVGTIPTTYDEVYNAMAALKDEYPEGREWTNFTPYGKDGPLADTYWWNGGPIKGASGGVGCAAFAFILSDHAFGDLPARTVDNGNFEYEDIKVGDILRIDNSHFVIVMQKSAGGVTVAEANYNKSVHWGRTLSVEDVMNSNFVVTRYPENFVPSDAEDADSIVQSGKEDMLDWSLTKAGILTVSGNGALRDYSPNDSIFPSWNSWNDSITSIVLKNGVTGIGNYAFYQSKALSAYLADTILRIGQSAFRESDLISITIPDSVKAIGDDAFRDCKNLSSATISEGVETIGERAFQGDTSLKYIDFPSTVTSIGSGSFASCENLIQVRFAPGTEQAAMGANIFTQCWRLQSVTLPKGLTALTPGMFSSCKLLYSLYIPESVTSLTAAGEESPFTAAAIQLIEYGGSEAQWNAMLSQNPTLRATLQNVRVLFNVAFDDPFAAIPGDPGDIKFDETDKPTNPDEPGGSETPGEPSDPGGSETPDNPSDPGGSETPDNPSDPGGSETPDKPSNPGGSETPGNPSKPNDSDHANSSPTNGDTETAGETGVQLSASMIDEAYARSEPVLLPITPVQAAQGDFQSAPSFTIQTGGKGAVAVAVPIAAPTPSTVLAIVNSDGSIQIIGKSALKDGNLIAALPDGATIKVVDNRKVFSDVAPGSPAADAIAFVTARELLPGTTQTTFSPDAPLTQAALLSAIARLDGMEASSGADWAIERSITDGEDLDANVTAEQLILMLWKYCDAPVISGAAESYTDESPVSKDVHDAMYWAVQNQIIDADFRSQADLQREITRAEIAQALTNFVNTLNFVG